MASHGRRAVQLPQTEQGVPGMTARDTEWTYRVGFWLATLVALTSLPLASLASTSAFETAPAEPRAITVKGQGDGRADDAAAIQSALDQAAERGGGGMV